MKLLKIAGLCVTFALLSACVRHHEKVVGVEFVDNKMIINDIFVIEGKPVVRYEKVTAYDDQQLVFLGPDYFVIQFKEKSFFEDADRELTDEQIKLIRSQGIEGDPTGIYPSKDGVVILDVSREKTKGLKVGAEFKYSVWVNGVELDPIGRYGGTEH